MAIDEEDALQRVNNGLMSADLILVDVVGKSVENTLQTARHIREQAKLDGNTPLVVMAEKYGKDLEGTDENVGGNVGFCIWVKNQSNYRICSAV